MSAAHEEPHLLTFHLDGVGSAADRAALLADPALRVRTRDEVLTVGDDLLTYVVEWMPHHLDPIAFLPGGRVPTEAEQAELGELAARLPLCLG